MKSSFGACADDPLAGLAVPPPASFVDPFASMAVSTAGQPEVFSPTGRSELPADMFSMPAVAPVHRPIQQPAYPQQAYPQQAYPGFNAAPVAPSVGMGGMFQASPGMHAGVFFFQN